MIHARLASQYQQAARARLGSNRAPDADETRPAAVYTSHNYTWPRTAQLAQ
jgi:hypothetical protein